MPELPTVEIAQRFVGRTDAGCPDAHARARARTERKTSSEARAGLENAGGRRGCLQPRCQRIP